MSKIICEICGTKYPDTAEQCPICGYANGFDEKTEAEEPVEEEVVQETAPKAKGGLFAKSGKRARAEEFEEEDEDDEYEEDDEDEDEYEDEEDDEDEEDEDEEKPSVLLNILLVIVILALLCVSGFIFTKYFMPNLMAARETEPATEAYVQTEEPVTEEPTVPCAELVLDEADIVLDEIGQMYLLNVAVSPEDTTDELTYVSSDENVVTVNEEGRLTVTGEGVAEVTITCGTQQIKCSVVVILPEETEAPEEEPTEDSVEDPAEEATEATEEPEGEKGVISGLDADHLNIRDDAGMAGNVVGSYSEGDVVYILERKLTGGKWWGRTEKGWISLKYVKFE